MPRLRELREFQIVITPHPVYRVSNISTYYHTVHGQGGVCGNYSEFRDIRIYTGRDFSIEIVKKKKKIETIFYFYLKHNYIV